MLNRIKKTPEVNLKRTLESLTKGLRDITEGLTSEPVRMARTAMLTVDYSGHGTYRKRTVKSSEPLRLRLDDLRIGASGLIVRLAPVDATSAYIVSDNDRWRIEVKILDFLSTNNPLMEGDLKAELLALDDLIRRNPGLQQVSQDGFQMACANLLGSAAEGLEVGRIATFINQSVEILFGMNNEVVKDKSAVTKKGVSSRMIEDYSHIFDEIGDFS